MKFSRRYSVMLTLCLGFLLVGCSESTEPEPPGKVELSLSASTVSDPMGSLVVSEINLENNTNSEIHYPLPCGYQLWLGMETEGGEQVLLLDPKLDLVCPPTFLSLKAGERLDDSRYLRWAYAEDGNRYLIPSGTYSLQAKFSYYENGMETRIHLETDLSVDIP